MSETVLVSDTVNIINNVIKAVRREVAVRPRGSILVLDITIADVITQACINKNSMRVKLGSGDEIQLSEDGGRVVLVINGEDVLAGLREKYLMNASLKKVLQMYDASDYVNIVVYLQPRKQH